MKQSFSLLAVCIIITLQHAESCRYITLPTSVKSPISAFLQLETEVTGCSSKNVSSTKQEIHAIEILSSLSHTAFLSSALNELPKIKLNIVPKDNDEEVGENVIYLVLYTTDPVEWQIAFDKRLATSEFRIFLNWQSRETTKIKSRFERPKVLILKRHATNLENMIQFAQDHLGSSVLTTISHLRLSNQISLQIGTELATELYCQDSMENRVTHANASLIMPQTLNQCVVDPSQDIDYSNSFVFGVSVGSTAGKNTVDVEITEHAPNIILVLHSPVRDIQWNIRTTSTFRGNLQLFSNTENVELENNSGESRVKLQRIDLNRNIERAAADISQLFPSQRVLVFQVSQATQITIDASQLDDASIFGETAFNAVTYPSVGSTGIIRTAAVKPTALSGWQRFQHEVRKHFGSDQPLTSAQNATRRLYNHTSRFFKNAIAKSMQVSCDYEESRVSAVLPSHQLQDFDDVILSIHNCLSDFNSTHFNFDFGMSECGTSHFKTPHALVYYNQIKFIRQNEILFKVPITCVKPTVAKLETNVDLKVFLDNHFEDELQNTDVDSSMHVAPGQSLHFEAQISDPKHKSNSCALVDACFMVFNKTIEPPLQIIQNNCPTSFLVRIRKVEPDSSQDTIVSCSTRFSLLIVEKLASLRFFLQCTLSTCGLPLSYQSSNILPRQSVCSSDQCTSSLTDTESNIYSGKVVVKGPFYVRRSSHKTHKTIDAPQTDVILPAFKSSNSQQPKMLSYYCEQKITLWILISAVVVSFLVGAFCMAILWCIKSRSGSSGNSALAQRV